jgi:hypothetical protein
MRRIFAHLTLAVIAFDLVGCSAISPAKQYGSTPLESLKTAYVVSDPNASHDIEAFVQEALADRGIRVTSGPISSKPNDVQFYVECEGHWYWDITMYLDSMTIRFKDNTNGELIAIDSFTQGLLHTYPDVRQTTFQIINEIYSRK